LVKANILGHLKTVSAVLTNVTKQGLSVEMFSNNLSFLYHRNYEARITTTVKPKFKFCVWRKNNNKKLVLQSILKTTLHSEKSAFQLFLVSSKLESKKNNIQAIEVHWSWFNLSLIKTLIIISQPSSTPHIPFGD